MLRKILEQPDGEESFLSLWEHIERRAGGNPSAWNGGQATFFHCVALANEINNGGLLQWHFNHGPLWKWRTRRALKSIGALQTLNFVREGGRVIRKHALMPWVAGKVGFHRIADRVPEDLDDPFFDSHLEEEVRQRLTEYVRRNPKQFE